MGNTHAIAATAGFISFALLLASLIGGVVLRSGWADRHVRQPLAYAIHQHVGVVGLTLGAVHGAAQLAMPGGPVTLVSLAVPFTAQVDPIGIGLGVLGFDILVAVALSMLWHRRLGASRWRAVHTASYAAMMAVCAHILLSGSDVDSPLAWSSVVVAWLVVTALWLAGIVPRKRRRLRRVISAGVQVDVDPVRCERFGFCTIEAPAVFRMSETGGLTYVAAPSAADAEDVARAVELCPTRAIALRRNARLSAARHRLPRRRELV